MSKPKYIMGKDFHKHVGETILVPHPTRPLTILPIKILIKGVENKKVILQQVGTDKIQTLSHSKDKNKYVVVS